MRKYSICIGARIEVSRTWRLSVRMRNVLLDKPSQSLDCVSAMLVDTKIDDSGIGHCHSASGFTPAARNTAVRRFLASA